jgi:hypothetical protein
MKTARFLGLVGMLILIGCGEAETGASKLHQIGLDFGGEQAPGFGPESKQRAAGGR